MTEKIQAILVLEILGRPPEHVKEALHSIVSKIGEEKGVKVLEKKLHEPTEIKDSKDLFTAFAEITVEMDNIGNFFGIVFAYMPSHIELLSPERFSLTNYDLNDMGNKIIQRLHGYDAITKNVIAERDLFYTKLKEIAPHLFQQKAPTVSLVQQEKKPKEKKGKKKGKKKKK